MDINPEIFGELDENGGIKRDVRLCAETGESIVSGDVMIRVPGTRYFYRLKAQLLHKITDDRRAELANQAGGQYVTLDNQAKSFQPVVPNDAAPQVVIPAQNVLARRSLPTSKADDIQGDNQ